MHGSRFERTKQHVNIAAIGHINHGKTTLAAAITKVLHDEYGRCECVPFDKIDNAPQENACGVTFSVTRTPYSTRNRTYTHIDCPSHADYVKAMIAGAARIDGAILVVSAADGVAAQTREQIRLARQVGVSEIVVYLNKCDAAAPERIEWAEAEIRETLDGQGFSAKDSPIIQGSALAALENRGGQFAADSIIALFEAVENHISTPGRDCDKPFMMSVENAYPLPGRGTVAEGHVERGRINLNDEVEIVGITPQKQTICAGMEMSHKLIDCAEAGDNVGVLLRGVDIKDVTRGQILVKPGFIAAHTKFTARVYVLTEEEGGRPAVFGDNSRPRFCVRNAEIACAITLPAGTENCAPGSDLDLTAKPVTPIAVVSGDRFALREDGRTVGVGLVLNIIE